MRIILLRKFLLRPFVIIVGIGLAALGYYDTIYPRLSQTILDSLGQFLETEWIARGLSWLSESWGYLFLGLLAIGIFEGFFQHTRQYLGDRIKLKKISFEPLEERPTKGDLYAALKITNGERVDLQQCVATLEKMQVFVGDEWIDWTDQINPNRSWLTWPDFNERTGVTIVSNKSARVNIARTDGVNNVVLIFRIGDEPAPMFHDKFYVEVSINAKVGDRRIEEILFTGFLLYDSTFISGSTVKIKGEIGHLDGTTEFTEKEEIIAPSVSYKLYIKPGKLIDGEMVYEEQEEATEKP